MTYQVVYLDGGPELLQLTFDDKEAYGIWQRRMDDIRNGADFIVNTYSSGPKQETEECRQSIHRWLEQVTVAAGDGHIVLPSILEVREEFLEMLVAAPSFV